MTMYHLGENLTWFEAYHKDSITLPLVDLAALTQFAILGEAANKTSESEYIQMLSRHGEDIGLLQDRVALSDSSLTEQ